MEGSLYISVLMLLCSVGYGNTRDEVTSATPCNNIVNCFVDPCMFASCRAYPQATCQSNYCGGCNAEFFDASGSDVTALCGSATTTVPRLTLPPLTLPPLTVRPPASCPPPSTGFGLCVEQCSSDSACPFGQLCCSTGCGHLCMNGIATPSPGCVRDDGTVVPGGFSFPSSDGCNTCFCTDGSIACTERACFSTSPTPSPGTLPPTPSPGTLPPRCALVRCAYPTCPDGATPIIPTGECCPRCPSVVCSAGIYPESFIPLCEVVARRWSFATDRSGCSEIRFSPCGQEEEGYNVFTDRESCERMCGYLTIGDTTPTVTAPTTEYPCTRPCPVPACIEGSIVVILPGQCCPTCVVPTTSPPLPTTPTPPDCTRVPCPLPLCIEGYILVTLPGQCCPTCVIPTTSPPLPTTPTPPDCTRVPCPLPLCLEGSILVTLPGQCCRTCVVPTTSPPLTATPTPRDCTGIFCDWPICPDGAQPVSLPGACCPSCPAVPTGTPPPVDCSLVRCALPLCAGGVDPIFPPGQCCGQCPETGGCVTPDGRVIASGNSFPAPDGCNTCYCGDDGTYGCTEIGCIDPPTPAVIRPTPLHALICPYVAPSVTGTCSEMCSSDDDCGDGQMCCSNGCGRACMTPDSVPYYSVPLECPSNRMADFVSRCDTTQPQCTDNSACAAADQLCCQIGGCGRYCTQGIQSTQPCFAVRDLFTSVGLGGLPGAFIPACQDDGSFSPSQFHGSTGLSWCADVRTGYPLSSFYPRGTMPQCSSCMDAAGNRYDVGDSFPSPDCNTCACGNGGRVVCTRIGCPATCSLPPETGPCRAAIPAFYYDQASTTCRSFTYGGCGGNANKFSSIHDCLTMCYPSGRCLQPPAVGECDALFPSFFFNSSSGACEHFNYGGCGGNQNRFTTRESCLTGCAPDALQDRCSAVDCAEPVCAPGSRLTRDETRCCPYCVETVRCGMNETQCSNGQCIPRDYVCDSLRDCPNGEDEFNCTAPCDFRCGDGSCIDSAHVCDSLLDCADHSDAENCSRELTGVVYLQPSDIPQQCPEAINIPATCGDRCGSGCREGQACCPTGCGIACTASIPVRPTCRSIARQVRQSGLLGAFTPSCEEDGSFSERQCRERFCWCVDVQTGQPVTNGSIAEQTCGSCIREGGNSLPVGASFSSDDGCNTCKCTQEHGIICTSWPCAARSCKIGDSTIAHQESYQDPCSACRCVSGSLSCNRTQCSRMREKNETVLVTMTFDGDFERVVDNEAQVIREVKRTLLSRYENLNLLEGQLQRIQLSKGSIVVSVTLEPTNTTAGANLTILRSQVEQDYMDGVLVIRYNGVVWEPTGQFQSSDSRDQSTDAASFVWWHILLIVVGAVLVLMVCFIIVVVVVRVFTRGNKAHRYEEKNNDYEVSYKKDDHALMIE